MENFYDDPDDQHMVIETTETDGLQETLRSLGVGFDGTAESRASAASSASRPTSTAPRTIHRHQQQHPVLHGFPSSGLNPTSAQIPAVIITKSRAQALPYSTSRSGLVYDSQMRYHVDQTDSNVDAHPEKPGRILEIFNELVDADLVQNPHDPESGSDYHLLRIPARRATEAELCLIHSREHIEDVKSSGDLPLPEIRARTKKGEGEASIYWHNLTWLCACLSAGGAIEATRAVVLGQVKNAVAVIRPPGHHAEHSKPSGFCFFNNVPIATRVVQKEFPDQIRKVLILDWDVHHGNGIQHAFESDPNVLYISLHVYQSAQFYPHSTDADHMHCGVGAGEGRNVNIPWMHQGMTDADYMLAFQQIVMPIGVEFDPDLVMISAGFDAANGDLLGGCFVSPAAYAHMTHMLMQLAGGKVVACLEGGYNLRSIAISALAMTRTMMGEPPERLGDLTPTPSAVTTIQQVIRTQSAFWKCLYPKELSFRLRGEGNSERLHDVIRDRQSKVLWENFQMLSLFVRREKISKSFKDQVLATQNLYEARPLLLIFHDPPQATDVSERSSSVLELHNTVVTDCVKPYIAWAVNSGFAVIDVNVPKYLTTEDDNRKYVKTEDIRVGSEDERSNMCRELAFYLWDNYIEIGESPHVFIMGVGEAFLGFIELLRNRREAITTIDLIVGFVAEQALMGVSDPDDDSVARTYYDHSLIFIANNHLTFDPDRKKPKRRHGRLRQSAVSNLQEMLELHRHDVTARLASETEYWRQTSPLVNPEVTSGSVAGDEDNNMDLDINGSAVAARESDALLPIKV